MSVMQSVIALYCQGFTHRSAWAHILTNMREFYASIAMMTQATAEPLLHHPLLSSRCSAINGHTVSTLVSAYSRGVGTVCLQD